MKEILATVKQNREIAHEIMEIRLNLSEDAGEIKGGQFVNLSVGDGAFLLKRPLGICRAKGRDITLCYHIRGDGTRRISRAKKGDRLSVLLPLGNGFDLGAAKNIAVVGGGVGIFPLAAVVDGNLKSRNFYSYIGFRSKEYACLTDLFSKGASFTVTTDDGSMGKKGNAVQAFMEDAEKIDADLIISCGPSVMLKKLKEELKNRGIATRCLVSLEERMGCGIGACLVCACKQKDGKNVRVCKDGPVFDINDTDL